jgi:hypothetical protein
MNQRSDIDRVLGIWMADGPSAMPDRVVDVVADRISVERQRRSWRHHRRPPMNPLMKLGAAVVAVLVIAAAWALLPGRDGSIGDSSATPTSTPVPNDESSLDAADLAYMVVTDSTVPDGLTVLRMLSSDDALRASELVPDDQSGVVDARLATLTRPSDDTPDSVGHTFQAPSAARYLELNGQYGSLAIVFETVADAEHAYEAAAATLQAPDGWGFEVETATSFASDDWLPAGGVRYFYGSEYGRPIVRAYLWRVDNALLFCVDFHVYDLPDVLQSVVEGMDARARSLAGQG